MNSMIAMGMLASLMADDDPKSRFLREYPAALAALRAGLSPARGVAIIRATPGGKAGAGAPIRFRVDQANQKIEWELEGKAPRGPRSSHVLCLSGSSVFELSKEDPARPYKIDRLGGDAMERAAFDSRIGRFLNSPWTIHGYDYPGLAQFADFELLGVTEAVDQGRALIEVNLKVGPGFGEVPDEYRIRFDPALSWAIVRSERHPRGNPAKWELTEIEYPAGVSDRHFPLRVINKAVNGKLTTCEFRDVSPTPTPPSEFRMEHYGVKEVRPPVDRPSALPLYGWAIAAAFGLFLVSRVLKNRAAR